MRPLPLARLKITNIEQDIILAYDWQKLLHELTRTDAVEFRSWLLTNAAASVARKVFVSFHSMVREMITRKSPRA